METISHFHLCKNASWKARSPSLAEKENSDLLCDLPADWEETLTNLHPERFAGTLLLGDFNVDFALTRDPRRKSYFHKLTAISDIFGLHQLVSDYTRTPDVGSPSMINLVFTSSAVQVFDVQVTEKLATSGPSYGNF